MSRSFLKNHSRTCLAAALAVWLTILTGCQTFSLSEEQFAQQQQGNYSQSAEAQSVELAGWLMQFFGPWLMGY